MLSTIITPHPVAASGSMIQVPGAALCLAEAVGQFDYAKGKGFEQRVPPGWRRSPPAGAKAVGMLTPTAAPPPIPHLRHDRLVRVRLRQPGRSWHDVKCPGVADFFRIPKTGRCLLQAQVSPEVRIVMQPFLLLGFGPHTPRRARRACRPLFSNCSRLRLLLERPPLAHAYSPQQLPSRAVSAFLRGPDTRWRGTP